MKDWVREGNQRLAGISASIRVLGSFSHTGSFVVESDNDRSQVATHLSSVFDTQFTVLSVDDLAEYASIMKKACPPEPKVGFRWTPGLVLAISDEQATVSHKLHDTQHASFCPMPLRAVGAWKLDQLTDSEVLDSEKRGGGWGAVSDDVSCQVGGKWTARSLRPVNGVLKLAREYASRNSHLRL
jgi:hypothetical protein